MKCFDSRIIAANPCEFLISNYYKFFHNFRDTEQKTTRGMFHYEQMTVSHHNEQTADNLQQKMNHWLQAATHAVYTFIVLRWRASKYLRMCRRDIDIL